MEGALLGPHLLLLVLQLLGYTDVVLHKLVLLDVGGVVLLNCSVEKGRVSGDWDPPKVSSSKEACTLQRYSLSCSCRLCANAPSSSTAKLWHTETEHSNTSASKQQSHSSQAPSQVIVSPSAAEEQSHVRRLRATHKPFINQHV